MKQGTRRSQLEGVLAQSFAPTILKIEDESHQHGGGRVESHFKVVVVSDVFDGKNLLARHKAVYSAVQDIMNQGIHALGLHCFTPSEWDRRMGNVAPSPQCRGGDRGE